LAARLSLRVLWECVLNAKNNSLSQGLKRRILVFLRVKGSQGFIGPAPWENARAFPGRTLWAKA
jgi:hypothetical protein